MWGQAGCVSSISLLLYTRPGRRASTVADTGTTRARRQGDRRLGGLAAASYLLAAASAAANMSAPLYPLYQQTFSLSPALLTVLYATYALVTIPALLAFGPAFDVLGRRPVLAIGAGATAVGAALLTTATGLWVLLAGRAVLGLALGAAIGAAPAAMVETEPNGNRHRASLLVTLAFVVGTGAGPILTGVLAEYAPAPLRLPYLVLLVLLLPAAVGLAAMGRIGRERRTRRWRPTRPSVPAGIRHNFAIAATSGALAWAVAALFLSLLPSFLATALSTTNQAATGGIVTGMLAVSAAAQLAGQRLPARAAQATGLAGLIAGLTGLIAAGATGSLAAILAATVLAGAGHGLAFLGAMTEITTLAPPGRRGEVTASAYVIIYAAVAAPVVGAGLLATYAGLVPAVSLFAVLLGAACLTNLAALGFQRRRRTDARDGRPEQPTPTTLPHQRCLPHAGMDPTPTRPRTQQETPPTSFPRKSQRQRNYARVPASGSSPRRSTGAPSCDATCAARMGI